MATDYAAIAMQSATGFYSGFILLVWALLAAAIVGFIIYFFTFNVRVRLRTITGSNDLIKDYRGKLTKDSEGTEFLKLFLHSLKMPPPPPEAVSLTSNGKIALDVEYSKDGGSRYLSRSKELHTFKPFNTNNRIFYANEIRKAVERKQKTFGELLMALAPAGVVIIIFALALIYWGDVMQPNLDFQQTALQQQKEVTEGLRIIKEILQKEQIIRDQEVIGLNAPPE